jgi:DNA-binding NarL/FixJ family response regulator
MKWILTFLRWAHQAKSTKSFRNVLSPRFGGIECGPAEDLYFSPAIERHIMSKEIFDQRDDRKPLPPHLQRVMDLLHSGLNQSRIAAALGLSPHTVRGYVRDIYRRFGVNGRLQLISLLRTRGIERDGLGLPPPEGGAHPRRRIVGSE